MNDELIGGRYRLLELIAEGNQGTVHKARDLWEDEIVAVKILSHHPDEPDCLAWADLRHPAIVQLMDIGRHKDETYFVLEWVSGPSLREAYVTGGEEALLPCIGDMCDALLIAHARGIIHGDIKPSNILLQKGPGDVLRAKLSDWVLPRPAEASTRGFSGTLAYAAPEVLRGESPDIRTDLYSLGACLYEILTGKPLFHRPDIESLVRAHLEEEYVDPRIVNPELSESIVILIRCLLEKEKTNRPVTISEIITRFNLALPSVPRGEPPFIDRSRESRFLGKLCDNAAEGNGSMIILTGEEGIGSSRFIERIGLKWGIRGFSILPISHRKYGELSDSIRIIINRLSSLAGATLEIEAESEPTFVAKAIFDLISTRGFDKPLMIILEDLRESESPAIRLVKALLPYISTHPIILCISTNREGYRSLRESIRDFTELRHIRRIPLRPFKVKDIHALCASYLNRSDIDSDLVDLLSKTTDGNPSDITESVKFLAGNGFIQRDHGIWRLDHLPDDETVARGLFHPDKAWLHNLSGSSQHLFALLAILDRDILVSETFPISELNQNNFSSSLKLLIDNQLIQRSDDRLIIRNRRAASSMLMALPENEKIELHKAVATFIHTHHTEEPKWYESLIKHLIGAGETEKALPLSLTYAGSIEDAENIDMALRIYTMAEQCICDTSDPRFNEVMDGQARCHLRLGNWNKAADALSRLMTSLSNTKSDEEEKARVQLRLATALSTQGKYGEANDHMEQALGMTRLSIELRGEVLSTAAWIASKMGQWKRSEELARACIEIRDHISDKSVMARMESSLGCALIRRGKHEEAEIHLNRSISMVEETGDTLGAVNYISNLGHLHFKRGDHEEAAVRYRMALSRAEKAGAIGLQAHANNSLGLVEVTRGFPRRAVAWYSRAYELATRAGSWRVSSIASINRACANLLLCEYGQAERELKDIHTRGKRKEDDYLVWASAYHLGDLFLSIGQFDISIQWFLLAREIAVRHDEPGWIGMSSLGIACAYRMQGNCRDAVPAILIAREKLLESGGRTLVIRVECEQAEIDLGLHQPSKSLEHLEKIEEEISLLGPLHRIIALKTIGKTRAAVGDNSRAAAAFEECLKILENTEYEEQKALVHLEVGRWLANHGQEPGFKPAERYLTIARNVFRNMGITFRIEEIDTILKSLRKIPGTLDLDQAEASRLSSLYRMVAIINSVASSTELLDQVLDLALHAIGGERGSIILVDESDGELVVRSQVELDSESVDDAIRISETVIRNVAGTGEPVFSENALQDSRFSKFESIQLNRIACFMCVPLYQRNRILGAIYADSKDLNKRFTSEDVSYLMAFAHHAAIAMENLRFREELERKNEDLLHRLEERHAFESIIGTSEKMKAVYQTMAAVVQSPVTVIIQGETGTGKELVARAIHHNGPRKSSPFIPVNCAAFPENLLESELFGYVKGAFTGAITNSSGLFVAAHDGTLFLDEIADMSLNLQAKLLRVLQTGEVRPLGTTRTGHVDVRIIAASNKDLEQEVRAGRMREDLYYRLKVITISVPPLRERKEDIPLLAFHFLNQSNKRLGREIRSFSEDALAFMIEYSWPGNVRELEHAVEAAVALEKRNSIEPETIRSTLGLRMASSTTRIETPVSLRDAQRDLEKRMVYDALKYTHWNISRAARRLGIARQQLQRIMKKYDLTPSAGG